MMIEILRIFKNKLNSFKNEAHAILSMQESSISRVISLDQTRKHLKNLSIQQDELFQQALACIQMKIYRAAHVMAWAAFIDYFEQKLASDGLIKVKSIKAGWNKYKTIEDLREDVPEHQLIEVSHDVRLLSKTEAKIILGLLSKRNECAHPSNFNPDLNESLGYVSELLNRIEQLQGKSL